VLRGDIRRGGGPEAGDDGDTLCDDKHPIIVERMEFPEPVIDVAIEAEVHGGPDKIITSLGAWRWRIRPSA
jgi:elongation factor G